MKINNCLKMRNFKFIHLCSKDNNLCHKIISAYINTNLGPFGYRNQKEGVGMRMKIEYILTFGYCNHLSFPHHREC